MSFVKSLPILRNLFGCSAASYTKTNRPGDTVTHVQVMPGATLKYEPIMFDRRQCSECEWQTVNNQTNGRFFYACAA